MTELPSPSNDGPAGAASEAPSERPRKGPLSFLSGSLTAGMLGWLTLGLSQRVVLYYGAHPPHYDSAFAQSIATALKTLIIGMSFLATFTFGFIAMGLGLVFVRSLTPGSPSAHSGDTEAEEAT
ncbi:DUF3082 domain-containing protein [Cyanobium sp. LEGE 06113]|uniref:DUF3082 domain-containing protein n=1 Tax=Cyanobium sp. LEGE 06113 TaxID=1297573 RepID=UPI0018808623|nr:DUF3082 domain-containing protein [Cyanobium sp. LEGE 06113]